MLRRVAIPSAIVLACSLAVAAGPEPKPVVGSWQGVLPNGMGGQIRVVLHVQQSADGVLKATMDSPDQNNTTGIPVAKVTFENPKVALEVTAVAGSYEGTLSPAGNEITGTWRQNGQELALAFKRDAAKE